ncbi:MAG: DUF222 domain-containing protein [Acidimicrobiia bacterium]
MFVTDPDPIAPVDPIALIGEGIARLAADDRCGWSDAARSALLSDVLEASDRLRAEVIRATGEWDACRAFGADGALSASSWIAQHAPVSKRDAHALVRTARLAFDHERTAKALASGDVSASQVEVLAAMAKGRARLFARDEDSLLDLLPTLTVDGVIKAAKHWRSCADDEMARRDEAHVFDTREVTMASTLFGRVEIRASLDKEGGAIVRAALDAYDLGPDPEFGAEAPRTVAQRRADALVQICSEAVGRLQSSPGARHVPTVELGWDVDRLARSETASSAGALDDFTSRRAISGVGPVGIDVAKRISCDAAVHRVVMRGESEVLDVGRSSRLVTRAQRRALDRRDGGCVFPACDAPIEWCDAHHLVHWADGGDTTLENLVLLCRRHHVSCHEGGWELACPPGGPVEVVCRGMPIRSRSRPQARDRTRPPGPRSVDRTSLESRLVRSDL